MRRGRPQKINANLYLDTRKKVTAWQEEEKAYRGQHKALGPEHELGVVPANVHESEVFPEEMEAYLLSMVLRQVIDENEYDLLVETGVYGRMTQKEWAQARGVPHATVRSWRHRAVQAIREHEKVRRK